MTGHPRRDSNDGTQGGPLHGRGGKSTDHNKGGGSKSGGKQQLDDNARPPNQ